MAENIETPGTTDQSQGAQTSAGGNAASKISSMLKGLQNFNVADFVKGKPGQWQKMAVVSVVVIIVMGLGAVMMWGLALWALANSFGEPSGNTSQCQGQSGTMFYPSGVDADSLTSGLSEWMREKKTSSPLINEASTFANAGQQNNVNPALMIAIAMQESELGTTGGGPPHNNPFGWACPPCKHFDSWSDSINHVTNRTQELYLSQGQDTISEIQQKWAPVGAANDPNNLNSDWYRGVSTFFNSIVNANPSLKPVDNSCSSVDFTGPGAIYDSNAFTATQIDNYLRSKSPDSPLNGKGSAFIASGKKYGVNPGFLLGITNAESSLGLQCKQSRNLLNGTNNAFGLTCGGQTTFCRYDSFETGIDRAAKNATTNTYKTLNGTIREFRLRWCGYETESEKSPVKLSNGVSITYDCKNGNSKWEEEVLSVMSGIK